VPAWETATPYLATLRDKDKIFCKQFGHTLHSKLPEPWSSYFSKFAVLSRVVQINFLGTRVR